MSDMLLLQPLTRGAWSLKNRVVMAPMTRSRAGAGNVVAPVTAEYYRQRASAGLIVSEGTQVSPEGVGYPSTPGIYNEAQRDGWRRITSAVHEAGGTIVAQLWHVGRVSHPTLQPDGQLPVAPSAIAAGGKLWSAGGMLDYPVPRALETSEIARVVADFANAARVARDAGFDGVELHGANGYLIDQFLKDGSNRRDDVYGGTIGNRSRFLLEVFDAVAAVWGAEKVGVRVSPLGTSNGVSDSNPLALYTHVARELAARGAGFLHVREEVVPGEAGDRVMEAIRESYPGLLITNGGYTRERAEQALRAGRANAVAFGVPYIANPDLVERFAADAPLATADRATMYGGGEQGYVDYPRWSEDRTASAA
jgi:N-ethylmaleimide reductase